MYSWLKKKDCQLKINDCKIIQTKVSNQTSENVDISNFTNGVYFVKVKTENGEKIEKLVKE